jgi:DNA-binding NtrC family response regulator
MESHTPSLEGKYQVRQSVKVLIVDEEASQRSGLAAMVSAWGMTANTASDGNDALANGCATPRKCRPPLC